MLSILPYQAQGHHFPSYFSLKTQASLICSSNLAFTVSLGLLLCCFHSTPGAQEYMARLGAQGLVSAPVRHPEGYWVGGTFRVREIYYLHSPMVQIPWAHGAGAMHHLISLFMIDWLRNRANMDWWYGWWGSRETASENKGRSKKIIWVSLSIHPTNICWVTTICHVMS